MKSLKNDVRSCTSGSSLGINTVPLISLKTVMPTVITRKTTASATDNADVNLKESAIRGRGSQNMTVGKKVRCYVIPVHN